MMVCPASSFFNKSSISRLQVLGYQRTLQVPDLWKMDKSRESATLSDKLDKSWAKRVTKAEEWNERLARGEVKPGLFLRLKWVGQAATRGVGSFGKTRRELETMWKDGDGRKEASLAWALNDTFGWHFWAGGLFKVCVLVFD